MWDLIIGVIVLFAAWIYSSNRGQSNRSQSTSPESTTHQRNTSAVKHNPEIGIDVTKDFKEILSQQYKINKELNEKINELKQVIGHYETGRQHMSERIAELEEQLKEKSLHPTDNLINLNILEIAAPLPPSENMIEVYNESDSITKPHNLIDLNENVAENYDSVKNENGNMYSRESEPRPQIIDDLKLSLDARQYVVDQLSKELESKITEDENKMDNKGFKIIDDIVDNMHKNVQLLYNLKSDVRNDSGIENPDNITNLKQLVGQLKDTINEDNKLIESLQKDLIKYDKKVNESNVDKSESKASEDVKNMQTEILEKSQIIEGLKGKLEKLSNRIQDLETQNSYLEDIIDKMKSDKDIEKAFQKDNLDSTTDSEITNQLRELQLEIFEKNQVIEDLKAALEDQSELVGVSNAESEDIKFLKSALEEQTEQIKVLVSEKEENERIIEKLKADIKLQSDMKKDESSESESETESNDKNNKLQIQSNAESEKIKFLKSALEEQTEQIKVLVSEKEENERIIEKLKADIKLQSDMKKDESSESESETESNDKKNNKLQIQSNAESEKIKFLKSALEEQTEKIKLLVSEKEENERIIEKLKADIKLQSDMKKDESSESESETESNDKKNNKLQIQSEGSDLKNEQLAALIERLNSDLLTLEKEKKAHEDTIESLKTEKKIQENIIEDERKERAANAQIIHELNNIIDEKSEIIEDLKNRKEILEQTVEELKLLSESPHVIEELNEYIDKLKNKCTEQEECIKKLNKELEVFIMENNKIEEEENEKAELKTVKTKTKEEVDDFEAIIRDLETKIHHKDNVIHNLEDKIIELVKGQNHTKAHEVDSAISDISTSSAGKEDVIQNQAIQSLNEKINQLEREKFDELSERDDYIQRLEDEIKVLQAGTESLKSELKDYSLMIQDLEVERENQLRVNDELKEEVSIHANIVQELKNDLAKLTQEKSKKNNDDSSDSEEESDKKRTDEDNKETIKNLTENKNVLESNIKELENSVQTLSENLKDKENRVEKLQTGIMEKDNIIAEFREQFSELQTIREKLEESNEIIDQSGEKLRSQAEDLENLRATISSLEKQVKNQTVTIEEMTEEKLQQLETVDHLREDLKVHRMKIEDMQEEMRKQYETVEDFREQLTNAKLLDNQTQIMEQEEELKKQLKVINELVELRENQEQRIEEIREKLNHAERSAAQNQLEAEEKFQKLEERLIEVEQENLLLRERESEYTKYLDKIQVEKEALDNQLTELQMELVKVTQSLEEERRDMEKLKHALEDEKREKHRVTQALEEERWELVKLTQALEEKRREMEKITETLEEERQNLEKITQVLEEERQEKSKVTKALEVEREELEKVTQALEEERREKEEREKRIQRRLSLKKQQLEEIKRRSVGSDDLSSPVTDNVFHAVPTQMDVEDYSPLTTGEIPNLVDVVQMADSVDSGAPRTAEILEDSRVPEFVDEQLEVSPITPVSLITPVSVDTTSSSLTDVSPLSPVTPVSTTPMENGVKDVVTTPVADLEFSMPEVEKAKPKRREMFQESTLAEGWVFVPDSNENGQTLWKKQYLVVSSRTIVFHETESDKYTKNYTQHINLNKVLHVGPLIEPIIGVNKGDVQNIFKIVFTDSDSIRSTQAPGNHDFHPVVYRQPTDCIMCTMPLGHMFRTIAALECRYIALEKLKLLTIKHADTISLLRVQQSFSYPDPYYPSVKLSRSLLAYIYELGCYIKIHRHHQTEELPSCITPDLVTEYLVLTNNKESLNNWVQQIEHKLKKLSRTNITRSFDDVRRSSKSPDGSGFLKGADTLPKVYQPLNVTKESRNINERAPKTEQFHSLPNNNTQYSKVYRSGDLKQHLENNARVSESSKTSPGQEQATEWRDPEFDKYPKYPISVLMKTYEGLPSGIDIRRKELYLEREEFERVFGMPWETYSMLPTWKQQNHKKKVGLF